jgi:glutamate/tyrosine decarboxylase-like PLP-dependent enzyme
MTHTTEHASPFDTQEFRALGHRIVDLLAEYLETLDQRPVFPDVDPNELAALFDESVPRDPKTPEEVIADLERRFLPYCTQVNHPGYMGLITPSATPVGALGDLIASALNQNIGAYSIGPAGVELERRVVRWLCDLAGLPNVASGNLTSGGLMANFVAMKLARDWRSGDVAQVDGVRAPGAVYTSEERHVSVDKAVDAVGLGRRGLRILPTDGAFQLRLDALEDAIARDRSAGVTPVAIVAMGGSTNTGAVDDLQSLRRIADREGMWLHVDAAYGGGVLLSDRCAAVLDGLASADSITIDPHKWFYAPLDVGAVLVRDARRLTASFGMRPVYLTDRMDTAGERYDYYVHSFEQSRRLRALKVWMSLQRYGTRAVGSWVEANVEQARRLHDRAVAHADFEPATTPRMSAVCLRFVSGTMSEEERADLHDRVARRVEESGRFWISTTVLKGRTWFRVNPVNFRTRLEDMDALFDLLARECAEAAALV